MLIPKHTIPKSEGANLMAKHKQKRPTRDEFELESIGEQLVEAKQEGSMLSLTVWGASDPVVGRIVEMDARTKLVHVEKHETVTKVPFMDIMRIEYAR
jgi:hypothetical protein